MVMHVGIHRKERFFFLGQGDLEEQLCQVGCKHNG